jgi:hypothetical protein
MSLSTIEVEGGKVVVKIGESDPYIIDYRPKFSLLEVVSKFCPATVRLFDKHSMYKDAGDMLGVSVKMFTKMLNGAMHRAYIAPHYDLIKRFGYFKGFLNGDLVQKVRMNRKYIENFIADNCSNTAAFGLLYDSPKEAKTKLGKGLWKKLCNNSATRNDNIVKLVILSCQYETDDIAFAQTIPSTLLLLKDIMFLHDLNSTIMQDFVKSVKKPLYKVEESHITKLRSTWYDCKRLMENEGLEFNPNWSIKRVTEEHDAAITRNNRKKYSDEEFDYCNQLPNTVTKGDFTATLVRTPLALYTIGVREHHCVAMYSGLCKSGQYIVYEITGLTTEVSILGFGGDNHTQHYHACNELVTNPNLKDFGIYVEKHIRSVFTFKELSTFYAGPVIDL